MTTKPNTPHIPDDDDAGAPHLPPHDELDALLRQWHRTNADKAAAGRDRLMETLARETQAGAVDAQGDVPGPFPINGEKSGRGRITVRSILFNRYFPLAAAAVVLAAILPFVLPGKSGVVTPAKAELASNIMMAPEGGRLDALDREGNLMGPCALKHTDVKAEISGRFSRVTVTQQYHNRFSDKIEAVYTFPLSDRAGVDRMTMTIGDRVIVGEVKERESARRIYEQARESGRTASLLEQERPNIFTQSVANIDPGATINIEISYVEIVAEHDGELCFDFPTVVSPRYIPGEFLSSKREVQPLPMGAKARAGIVLAAPATVAVVNRHEIPAADPGERTVDALGAMLAKATPIATPEEDPTANTALWYDIDVAYPDGSKEPAVLLADGRGEIAGRWFYSPTSPPPAAGEAFSQRTNKVPDADRITPMPTRPDVRAGHDISISVTIDTGGAGIATLDSPLHKTVRTDLAKNASDQPRRVSIALASLNEIPNRDFVLKWKQHADSITKRVFTNTGEHGNFFALQLEPPARVDDDTAVPRELVFVVDTSGSMNGRPMALSRAVMQKAIDAMRPQDTFNIITFAGATKILWERPRPNTPANRTVAQNFIETWEGAGGTEMMTAIEAALRQTHADASKGTDGDVTLEQLANLPADGRAVRVIVEDGQIDTERMERGGLIRTPTLNVREGLSIKSTDFTLSQRFLKRADQTVADDSVALRVLVHGTWTTEKGERILKAENAAEYYGDNGVRPLRIVMFLTDAEVGNDYAIIDAIKRNRSTTRVFSFGIGNSVNRFLIDQMALAGGGEPEYVYAQKDSDADADAAVERFNRRTKTPILTDITLTFVGVKPLDVLPAAENIPDLFDNRPLTFLGRYTTPGVGAVTIKGQTARGKWEQTIPLNVPVHEEQNSSLPTLWARAKIDAVMNQDLPGIQAGQPSPDVRSQIVTLGETFNVMSQYTSFVAVDKLRVTINGKPRLVHVPVELPDQTNWDGYFGDLVAPRPGAPEAARSESNMGGVNTFAASVLTLKDETIKELMACSDAMTKQADDTKNQSDPKTVSADSHSAAAAVTPPPPPPPSVAVGRPPTTTAPAPAGPAGAPTGATARGGGGANSAPSPGSVAAKPASPAKEEIYKAKLLTMEAERKVDRAPGSPKADGNTFRAMGSVGSSRRDDNSRELHWKQRSSSSTASDDRLGQYGLARSQEPTGNTWSGYDRGETRQGKLSASAGNNVNLKDSLAEGSPQNFSRQAFADKDFDVGQAPTDNLVALAAAQLADEGRLDEAKSLACSNLGNNLALSLTNRAANNAFVPYAQSMMSNGSTRGGVQQSPAQPPVDRICGALNSPLPEAEKKAAIDEARAQASAEIREARKNATVYRKLAPDLMARTPRGLANVVAEKTPDGSGTQSLQVGVPVQSGGVSLKDAAPSRANEKVLDKAAGVGGSPHQAVTSAGVLVTVLLADTSTSTLDALKALGFIVEIVKPEANVVIGRIPADKLEEFALMSAVRRVELVPEDAK